MRLVEAMLSEYTATATAGLVLAVAMMFSFRQMVSKRLEEYTKIDRNLGQRLTIAKELLKNKSIKQALAPCKPRKASDGEVGPDGEIGPRKNHMMRMVFQRAIQKRKGSEVASPPASPATLLCSHAASA